MEGRSDYAYSDLFYFYQTKSIFRPTSRHYFRIITYNYFLGKLQIVFNNGFPQPILSTKHPSLRSGYFVDKIGNHW